MLGGISFVAILGEGELEVKERGTYKVNAVHPQVLERGVSSDVCRAQSRSDGRIECTLHDVRPGYDYLMRVYSSIDRPVARV